LGEHARPPSSTEEGTAQSGDAGDGPPRWRQPIAPTYPSAPASTGAPIDQQMVVAGRLLSVGTFLTIVARVPARPRRRRG
jgi:hypothetical protein